MICFRLVFLFLLTFAGAFAGAASFYEPDRCFWQSTLLGKMFTGEKARKTTFVFNDMLERNPERAPGFRLDEVNYEDGVLFLKKYVGWAAIGPGYELHVEVLSEEYKVAIFGKIVKKEDGIEKVVLKGSSFNSNYGIDFDETRSLALGFSMEDSVISDVFDKVSIEDFEKSNQFDSPLISTIAVTCTAIKTP
jgi:hypothetical protein